MNSTQVAHVRKHVAAVTRLLLGRKVIEPTLAILGGVPLTPEDRIETGRMAADCRADLIHLAFTIDEAGTPVMGEITVFLPRGALCYSWAGCRLSLLPDKRCAVIDPQFTMAGHLRVLAGELVQVNSKPAALDRGAERAAARLAALVRDGVDLSEQAALNDLIDV